MLNFSAPSAASWPTPPSTAVPAVTPITPVQPAQGAGREAQTGLGSGQNRSPAQPSKDGAGAQTALPRGTDLQAQAQAAREREADAAAQREAQATAAREMEQRAEDKEAIYKQLKEVLSRMWQASAAVVDQALGRDPAPDAPGVGPSSTSGLSSAASALLARPASLPVPAVVVSSAPSAAALAQTGDAVPGAGQQAAPTEVVAYDERGNGSLAAIETGSLVNQRV